MALIRGDGFNLAVTGPRFLATEGELPASGAAGDSFILGSTDTIWVWDADANAWADTGIKGGVLSPDLTGKADKAPPAIAGNLAGLTALGNLQDSGVRIVVDGADRKLRYAEGDANYEVALSVALPTLWDAGFEAGEGW